jgi:hypothetical protein
MRSHTQLGEIPVGSKQQPNINYILFLKFHERSLGKQLFTVVIRTKLKLNSVAWVRERTTPTERPPLVGERIHKA